MSASRELRVLALTRYNRQGASSRMRAYQFVEPLAREGVHLEVSPLFQEDYLEALYQGGSRIGPSARAYWRRAAAVRDQRAYDGIWVEKEIFPWVPAGVELGLLPRRTPLIADYDDAVFHRYDMHRLGAVRGLLGRKLDRFMARADLVVAGNDYLAARATAAGAPHVEVVPTVIDLARYPVKHPMPGRVTVGWIGSPATAHYLAPLEPVLSELAEETGLRAVAIGATVGSLFEVVPWSEDGEVEALADLDIGVMPLADSPWERGKCGYKLIQYMAMGLPVVASPVGVNTTIVRHGENGFLAANDDEWRTHLRALASDPQLRETMGRAGRRMVEETYSLQVQGPRLARLMRQAIESRRR